MTKPGPSPENENLGDGHDAPGNYAPLNHCFGCGKDNPEGMQLKFHLDEITRRAVCQFVLAQRYQGPPGHAHGGIIATILDEAMGKVNKLHKVLALTRQMEVEYVKPVPLGKLLWVTAQERESRGRKYTNLAEITDEQGVVLARGAATFIAIDPHKMFSKFVKAPE